MYQNAIYICISWYGTFCWFPMKKCTCQQNLRGVSRDSYCFLDLLGLRYNCAKFHYCAICMTNFREGGSFLPPSIREHPQKNPSWIGLRIIFVNMVTILTMSERMGTLGLLKVKVFWNNSYDVIIYDHDVTNKIFSHESTYIVGVVMWPKFGNCSISMKEGIITSIL